MKEAQSVSDLISNIWSDGLVFNNRKQACSVFGELTIGPQASILTDSDKPTIQILILSPWLFHSIAERADAVMGGHICGHATIHGIADKNGLLGLMPDLPVIIDEVIEFDWQDARTTIENQPCRLTGESQRFEVLWKNKDHVALRSDREPYEVLLGSKMSTLTDEFSKFQMLIQNLDENDNAVVQQLNSRMDQLEQQLQAINSELFSS